MVNGCERNYHRALKELQRLQVARAHGLRAPEPAAEPPQPLQFTTSSANLASIRQNPKASPPVAPKPPDATLPASPLADPHASASPAKTWSRPSDLFPDPDGSN
jgi:hypothetical protein